MTHGPAHDAGGGWVPRVRRRGEAAYQPVHDAEVAPAHLRGRGAPVPTFTPVRDSRRSWRRLASLVAVGGVGAVVVVLVAGGVLGDESPPRPRALTGLAAG